MSSGEKNLLLEDGDAADEEQERRDQDRAQERKEQRPALENRAADDGDAQPDENLCSICESQRSTMEDLHSDCTGPAMRHRD